MTFRDTIRIAWSQFSGKQKWTIAALSTLLTILIFVGGLNSFSAWGEYRQLEADAKQAKKEADAAMHKASQIANLILEREAELQKIEGERNEKQIEVDAADVETRDAVDDVNRARVQPRADKPSAKRLCTELASLGYPCR